MMDLRDLASYRWRIGGIVGLVVLAVWYGSAYRWRAAEAAALASRHGALTRERDQLVAAIALEEQMMRQARRLPTRVVPPATAELSPIERLNVFLEGITRPANDLDLSYFTVTPRPPVSGPGYQEVPFAISVEGGYPALADFLYQLEYGRSFVVRDLGMKRGAAGTVRADFQLSALLLNPGSSTDTAAVAPRDPGRPTSLELARDPFIRPPARVAVGPDGRPYFLNVPPGLHLTGIMKTGVRPVAIINHEPYGIGEAIDNKKITRIDSRGVELADGVRTYFLEMEQPPPTANGRAAQVNRR